MQFNKMHASGNDFVVFGNPSQTSLPDKTLISHICNRRYGVGADCVIFVGASKKADYFMHVFNPNGFEAEICGNALICSAQYVKDCGFFKKQNFFAETLSGIKNLSINEDIITAEIGKPEIISKGELEISGVRLPYFHVSLGNPHCVVFTTGLSDPEFCYFGSSIENHPIFPNGTNVEFMTITESGKIAMRVWERGIGETLSCSTGSCACVAAAIDRGYDCEIFEVYQSGGIVRVKNDEKGKMYVFGKCKNVFKGNLT